MKGIDSLTVSFYESLITNYMTLSLTLVTSSVGRLRYPFRVILSEGGLLMSATLYSASI